MEWQKMESAPRPRDILLWLGETIPDHMDIRVGSFIDGEEAEELGYREYAKYGAWFIWNSDCDFFAIDVSEPLGWAEVPKVAA